MSRYVQKHISKLRSLKPNTIDPYTDGGMRTWKWATGIFKSDSWIHLPNTKVNRKDLFLYSKSDMPSKDLFMYIMSWGGMKPRNATYTEKLGFNYVLKTMDDLRTNKISSFEAYEQLHSYKKKKKIGGMNPAFYTKLIYFCSTQDGSFIMD